MKPIRIIKNCVYLFLSLTILSVTSSAAELIYQNGFETGDLTRFHPSGNPPVVTKELAFKGKYAGNFNLTREMKTPYRTEVTVGKPGIFDWDTEYWVGLSFRLENWALDKSMEIAPFQVHPTPADWNDSKHPSQISTGPVMMTVVSGEMRVYTYGGKVQWSAPVKPGKWARVILHYIPSFQENGLIELWYEGEKVVEVKGVNADKFDYKGRQMRPPYWKMGVYKWEWKTGRPPTDSTRRQLFIDDFKIAKGEKGFSLVK